TTDEAEEPTAAELIAYQAAYDAAAQSVDAARQALAQATIVSPIAGTVVSVGVAPGDDVTEASDTQTIVVQGDGGYEATLSVSVDDIDRIALGQSAELVPDGGGTAVTGQVVAISQVPDSSGTTANYRVTVGLAGDSTQLRDGNIGDVAIVVDQRDDTLAVPTSAVTPTATGYTVDVLGADDQVSTIQVEVGAIGTEWTEIRRGIDAGQTVVIADLDEPLPGTATDSANADDTGTVTGFPGGGAFPGGGGFPGGGFPGGRTGG
ncbi:MAG: efflux RND transporter periplasmic adaptor subunit, partial [Ilumatobacteraceae bacterium]